MRFCNRWVDRVRQADTGHRTRFGAKQGRTFQQLARRIPRSANVESIVLVEARRRGREKISRPQRGDPRSHRGLPEFRFFAIVLQIFPTPSPISATAFSPSSAAPLFGNGTTAACR